jgi:hypothetical protein
MAPQIFNFIGTPEKARLARLAGEASHIDGTSGLTMSTNTCGLGLVVINNIEIEFAKINNLVV